MDSKSHWEKVYSEKAATSVSWYQEHATTSLNLIQSTNVAKDASVIDVGGGASTLIDDLLFIGYTNLSVLDLSGAALVAARERIGLSSVNVNWLEADVTKVNLPLHQFDVWHDRAVFHFLNTPEDRAAYVKAVLHAVKPGGHVIIATFAEDGPIQCSGLPVMRYSADGLHKEFGDAFTLSKNLIEVHSTPFGTHQNFVYCYFRKTAL